MRKPEYRLWVVYLPCTNAPDRWRNGVYQPAHRYTRTMDPDTPWLILIGILLVAGIIWAAILTS